MQKYISFKIFSVTAKRMIFSWVLQKLNEAFFILSMHTTPKYFLWFLYCVYIAYQYVVLAKLQSKRKK